MSAAKREILGLYRVILRRGRRLVYTDKDYFRKSVRREFQRWKNETEPEKIQFHIEVRQLIEH